MPIRPSRSTVTIALLAMLACAGAAVAADSTGARPSPWDPMRFFLGAWSGTGRGQPGTSTIEREYRFALGNRYFETRNVSTYLPQEKNPKGETHEDRGFISWDRRRHRFVYRQFHVEGFVNQYVADSLAAPADSVVFTSESIENIPAGFRARETWRILGPDEFIERFEMAEPGGAFEVYSEARLKRKK